jgi:hypothetical protein
MGKPFRNHRQGFRLLLPGHAFALLHAVTPGYRDPLPSCIPA